MDTVKSDHEVKGRFLGDFLAPDDMERRRSELSVPATLRVFPDVEFSSTEDAVLRLASGRELAVEVRI